MTCVSGGAPKFLPASSALPQAGSATAVVLAGCDGGQHPFLTMDSGQWTPCFYFEYHQGIEEEPIGHHHMSVCNGLKTRVSTVHCPNGGAIAQRTIEQNPPAAALKDFGQAARCASFNRKIQSHKAFFSAANAACALQS